MIPRLIVLMGFTAPLVVIALLALGIVTLAESIGYAAVVAIITLIYGAMAAKSKPLDPEK